METGKLAWNLLRVLAGFTVMLARMLASQSAVRPHAFLGIVLLSNLR